MFLRLWTRAPRMTICAAIFTRSGLKFLQLVFDEPSILVELLLRRGLEAKHKSGLSIGCADQAPAIRETNPSAVDIDQVEMLPEIVRRLGGDREFFFVGTIDTNLGRRYTLGQIGQEARQRFARFCDDFEQTERGVNRVVE